MAVAITDTTATSTPALQLLEWPEGIAYRTPESMPNDDLEDETPRANDARSTPTRAQQRRTRMTRDAFIKSITRPNGYLDPANSRIILTASFVDKYFPKDGSVFQGYEFLNRSAPSSPVLGHLLDMCYCLYAGVYNDDKRLLRASKILYQKGLQSLQVELKRPKANRGHLIGAIHMLQSAEIYSVLGLDEFSWRRHIPGLVYAVKANPSERLEPQVQTLLSGTIRLFALWEGLLSRKTMGTCDALWPQIFDVKIWGSSAGLNDIAMKVPGVLQDTDTIVRYGKAASRDVVTFCMKTIITIEGDLHGFMHMLCKKLPGQAYWITGRIPFLQLIECPKDSSCPSLGYSFPNLGVAHMHTTYWMCLLALRQAQLDIRKSMTKAQYPFPLTKAIRDKMTNDAGECAMSLIMTIPYMLEFARLASGYMALACSLAPLQMAYLWYKQQKDLVLMTHCQRIGRYIESLGIRCSWADEIV